MHITKKARYSTILHIKNEKYRSDLALTLSIYLYGGLFLILILNTGLPRRAEIPKLILLI